MSKLVNFGTFCGGIGGLVAGIVGALQFASNATSIKSTSDLVASIEKLAEAIPKSGLSVEVNQISEITNALTQLSGEVAVAVHTEDGNLPFVPRAYTGVSNQPLREPYDLVANNGVSRLVLLNSHNDATVGITVDGEYLKQIRPGGNADIDFIDQTCRIELIELNYPKTAKVRTRCM
ncbi:hypothetical protein HW561_21635 [Rhodobacteraceae bacterium B1Z28]|uniref:Uncharacterized protein n=1 Tax=Ruegeria haliotis TaxID=2747601 RepID=A0ABX2PW13_9RHOB|nr:hypothetical protein [Ruegeria haliotis]NVO58388.1 hypothetical protein [Ruegeria haliotis]